MCRDQATEDAEPAMGHRPIPHGPQGTPTVDRARGGTGRFTSSGPLARVLSFKAQFLQHVSVLVAWLEGTLMVGAASALVWPVVAWWWPLVDTGNLLLEGFLYGVGLFASYLLWGLALLLVIAVVRNVFRLSVPAGRHEMRAWSTLRFYLYNVLIMTARYLFLPFTRSTSINVVFYRAMGATIGPRTVINTVHVYDCNLLTLGQDVTIGGSSVVMCHMGQGNDMYIAPVTIEDGASLGEGAIVFPGAHIGAGAVIGAGSVVPRDTEVPPHTKWSGVPIQQVGRGPATQDDAEA